MGGNPTKAIGAGDHYGCDNSWAMTMMGSGVGLVVGLIVCGLKDSISIKTTNSILGLLVSVVYCFHNIAAKGGSILFKYQLIDVNLL